MHRSERFPCLSARTARPSSSANSWRTASIPSPPHPPASALRTHLASASFRHRNLPLEVDVKNGSQSVLHIAAAAGNGHREYAGFGNQTYPTLLRSKTMTDSSTAREHDEFCGNDDRTMRRSGDRRRPRRQYRRGVVGAARLSSDRPGEGPPPPFPHRRIAAADESADI